MKNGDYHPPDKSQSSALPVQVLSPRIQSPADFIPVYDYGQPGVQGSPSKKLLDYIMMFSNRKWWIVSGFFLVTVLTAIYTFFLCAPVYRSVAFLEVDDEARKTLRLGTQGELFKGADVQYYATQLEILKNRALVEKLINKMNLQEFPEFQKGRGILATISRKLASVPDLLRTELLGDSKEPQHAQTSGPTSSISQATNSLGDKPDKTDELLDLTQKEELIQNVTDKISIQAMGRSQLIGASVEAGDRDLAKNMLQTYLDLYLDQNLTKRRSESRDAVSWLRNELADVHNNLTKSREKLGDLTAAHGVVSLEREFNHVASSFISAADNLVKAREARIKLQALLNQEDKGGPSILPQVANQEHLLKMKGYLAEVEAEYIKATTLYSSDNPRVVMMKMKVDDLRDRIRESERATVSASLAVAMKEEDLSRAQFDESRKKAMDLNAVGVQYAILQKEIETSQTTYQLLLQKTREMEVSAGVTGNNIGILLRPTKPARPERPKKLFNLLIGCVLGLIVGILAAVVRELTDKSIKSNNDLREHVNLPSLGTVPNIESLKPRKLMQLEKPLYELLANQEPQSPFYDVLKDIQTSIMISSDGGSNILGITSACPQEGKTFLAVAMATVMCADSKVLLVDCDLREPRIHKIFSKDGTKLGLSTLLTNKDINPQEVIIPSVLPNLDIMTCGPLPPNPAAVLGRGAQLINLFRILREEYPLVILDCPPILGFPDTRILTLYADEYVLVVKAGQYGPDVKKAVDLLSDSKARLLGGILNMTRLDLSDDRLRYGRYLKHYSRSQSTLEPRLTKY